jgi:hypothetical protein
MTNSKNTFLAYARAEIEKDPELAEIVQADLDKRQVSRGLRSRIKEGHARERSRGA